jgi:hypothetical protein
VEQAETDAVFEGDVTHHPLCFVDFPLRGSDSSHLVGVGITEHHLLAVAVETDDLAVGVVLEKLVEEVCRVLQVVDGFDDLGRDLIRAGQPVGASTTIR